MTTILLRRLSRSSNIAKFLPLVWSRIVSGHLTQNHQLCAKCKTFNFSQQVRWKIRICATGRKFAEYDQCVQCKTLCTLSRDELIKANSCMGIARTKNDNKRSKHAYGHPANTQSKADINFDKGNVSKLFRILWNWIACVLMFNVCFYRKSTSVNRHTLL
jgi:hypothetical protein